MAGNIAGQMLVASYMNLGGEQCWEGFSENDDELEFISGAATRLAIAIIKNVDSHLDGSW